MNVLRIVGKVAGALFGIGGSASSGPSPVEKIAEIADEYKYTEEEKVRDEDAQVAAARAYEPSHMLQVAPIQQQGIIQFTLEWVLRMANLLIDAAIHLIRPWITVVLFGALFGYWKLPDVESIHPAYIKMIDVVMLFWFGARVVTKDLPALVEAWSKTRAKNGKQ